MAHLFVVKFAIKFGIGTRNILLRVWLFETSIPAFQPTSGIRRDGWMSPSVSNASSTVVWENNSLKSWSEGNMQCATGTDRMATRMPFWSYKDPSWALTKKPFKPISTRCPECRSVVNLKAKTHEKVDNLAGASQLTVILQLSRRISMGSLRSPDQMTEST